MRQTLSSNSSSVWGLLLAISLAGTWVVWGVKTLWPLLFALVGLWALLKTWRAPGSLQPLPTDVNVAAKWLAFAAIYYCTLRLVGYALHGNRWNVEPLLPFLLFAPLMFGVYSVRISHRYFWMGAGLAAIAACMFALYQHYYLGIGRANGHMNAITFGNTSVVLSLTCLIGATCPLYIRKRFSLFLIIGSICAAYASLLSGSKGGWLGLLMIYGLGAYRYWNEFGRQSPWAVAGLLLGLVCTVGFLMPVHVLDRIFSGAIGAYIWFTQGVVTDGSVSFRLELWRMAWYAFLESPLLGLSSDEIFSRMKTLVDAGVLNEPALLQYPTIDSQFFGDLAEGGLLGLSSTVALLICPLVAFARFRHHQNLAVRELGLVAVWVCLLFAEFGLSASLWGQSTYRQFYVSWLLLLLGLIAVELSKATEPAHEA